MRYRSTSTMWVVLVMIATGLPASDAGPGTPLDGGRLELDQDAVLRNAHSVAGRHTEVVIGRHQLKLSPRFVGRSGLAIRAAALAGPDDYEGSDTSARNDQVIPDLALRDVDNDGLPDLVWNGRHVQHNLGGHYGSAVDFHIDWSSASARNALLADFAHADLNGDGRADLVLSPFLPGHTGYHIFLQHEGGHFAQILWDFQPGEEMEDPAAVVAGRYLRFDVDDDGSADSVYRDAGNRIWIARQRPMPEIPGGLPVLLLASYENPQLALDGSSEAGPVARADDASFVDADGDGRIDIVWRSGLLHRNRGDGSFEEIPGDAWQVPAEQTLGTIRALAQSLANVDLNGDGRNDILLREGDLTSGWLALPRRSGKYLCIFSGAPIGQVTTDSLAGETRIGDVDGDGDDDLVYRSWRNRLYLSERRGGWQDPVEVFDGAPLLAAAGRPTTFAADQVTWRDLDLDGRLDCVWLGTTALLGLVAGQTTKLPWGDRAALSVAHLDRLAHHDLDDDGRDDVLVASPGGSGFAAWLWRRNDWLLLFDGLLVGEGDDGLRRLAGQVIAVDVDGDNDEDRIYISALHTAWLRRREGNGWADPIAIADGRQFLSDTAWGAAAVEAIDVNLDHRPDLVWNGTWLSLNAGDGSLHPAIALAAAEAGERAALALIESEDLNGDGHADAFWQHPGSDGLISAWLGRDDGHFTRLYDRKPKSDLTALVGERFLLDCTDDNRHDACFRDADNRLWVAEARADGRFKSPVLAAGADPRLGPFVAGQLGFVDVDRDRRTDLVWDGRWIRLQMVLDADGEAPAITTVHDVFPRVAEAEVPAHRLGFDGDLIDWQRLVLGDADLLGRCAVYDVNLDGSVDALVHEPTHGTSNRYHLFLGDGAGGWQSALAGFDGDEALAVGDPAQTADLDRDGWADRAWRSGTGDVWVSFGQPAGGFAGPVAVHRVNGASGRARQFALHDLDHDGDADLLWRDDVGFTEPGTARHASLAWAENQGQGAFAPAVATWQSQVQAASAGGTFAAANRPFAELQGGPGDDTLRGHNGHDVLIGRGGSNRLYGRGGNDRFVIDQSLQETAVFDQAGADVLAFDGHRLEQLQCRWRSNGNREWRVLAGNQVTVAVTIDGQAIETVEIEGARFPHQALGRWLGADQAIDTWCGLPAGVVAELADLADPRQRALALGRLASSMTNGVEIEAGHLAQAEATAATVAGLAAKAATSPAQPPAATWLAGGPVALAAETADRDGDGAIDAIRLSCGVAIDAGRIEPGRIGLGGGLVPVAVTADADDPTACLIAIDELAPGTGPIADAVLALDQADLIDRRGRRGAGQVRLAIADGAAPVVTGIRKNGKRLLVTLSEPVADQPGGTGVAAAVVAYDDRNRAGAGRATSWTRAGRELRIVCDRNPTTNDLAVDAIALRGLVDAAGNALAVRWRSLSLPVATSARN